MLVFKYAITFFLTTLVRAKVKEQIPDFMDQCKAYINKHIDLANWLVVQFTNVNLIKEFIFDCNNSEIRRYVVGLIYCAMLKLYENDKENILQTGKFSVLTNFANCVFRQLEKTMKNSENIEQYFQLLSRIAILGPEIREYFIKKGAVKGLFGFCMSDKEANWNPFTELQFVETEKVELGPYSEPNGGYQSSYDEYMMRRDQMAPTYTFMLELLGLLFRSTIFEEKLAKSPLALPKCGTFGCIDKVTKNILWNYKAISFLLKECRTLIASNGFNKGLAHLAWENMEYKAILLKAITYGIGKEECFSLQQFLTSLAYLMMQKDSLQNEFVKIALKDINTVMKENQNAYFATLDCIEFVGLLIPSQVPAAAEWYIKNVAEWGWQIQWLKQNPTTPSTWQTTGVRPYKTAEANRSFNLSFNSNKEKQTYEKTKSLLDYLNALKEGIIFLR